MGSRSIVQRLSSSYTAQSPSRLITVLFTNSHSSSFSTTASSASALSRRIQHEEESRSVRVSVWWDLENCDLPLGANVFKLAQSITAAIRNVGIKGPITITAFGDFLKLPRSNQEALTATGISLAHVPQGGKNTAAAHSSLIMDLMCWVSQNPPPAHLFLISSDKEFASVLHRLRMSNYNILLASKSSAPGVLCSAASIMWDWDGLVKGENVSGKHFNQPPDGPYNSWYGHYRNPILDPFATPITEQSSKNEELSKSSSNSVNVRPVPKEVVEKIRHILSLYPMGVFISVLHAELFKSDVAVDKDFYGYKKFSRFLQSMPDILQVSNASDGNFMIHAVTEKTVPTGTDSSPGLSTVNGSSPKLNSNVELAAETRRDDSLGNTQQKVAENEKYLEQESQERSQEFIVANDKPMETNQVALIAGSDSSMEDGFFEKLKRLMYGSTGMESKHFPEDESVSGSGDKEKVDKDLKSSSQGANSTSQILPSSAGESSEEAKAGTDEGGNNDKNVSQGFFSKLLKSFKFWGRNTGLSNDSSGNQKLVDVDSQEHEIFAKESFWSDVESFINSPRGFTIVSHSRTREAMAKNMQKEGPSCLRLLDESSMLHLVTLLISHKKWIQESPSSSLPFSINKGSSPSNRHASNGLSSIFADCSKSQRQKQDGYKTNAIADCQKLIKKMTEENPEGYSLFRFRKDFLEEYGYYLAVDKLGYESLQSLIKAMPGVRIASGYILPSPDAKSIKEDDSDCSFEELGPVSEATTNQKLPVYEPSLSEDEDSGSERDNPRKKKKNGGEDRESSLLQILDSYYTSKDGEKPGERKLVSNIRKQKPSKTYSFVKDSEV